MHVPPASAAQPKNTTVSYRLHPQPIIHAPDQQAPNKQVRVQEQFGCESESKPPDVFVLNFNQYRGHSTQKWSPSVLYLLNIENATLIRYLFITQHSGACRGAWKSFIIQH